MSARAKPKQGAKRPMVTRSATGNSRPKRTEQAKRAKVTNPAEPKDNNEEVEFVQLFPEGQSEEGVLGNTQKEPFIDFENVLRPEGHINTSPTTPLQFQNPIDRNNSRPLFQNNLSIMRCGGDDLGVHVPLSVCQKIWTNQYINLSLLLKGNVELQELCSSSVLKINENGTIQSQPKVVTEQIPNIEKWTDAFLIFVSIYAKHHPDKVSGLLQYMSVLREQAFRNKSSLAWRQYDEQFRLRQEHSPQSWGEIHSGLWHRIMSPTPSDDNPASPVLKKAATQAKICLDFNRGLCYWHPCKYNHACSNCASTSHGASSCPQLTQSQTPNFVRGTNNRFRGFRGGRSYRRNFRRAGRHFY